MTLFGAAFGNWRRRPLRTTLTVVGVAIAVTSLFSLLSFQKGFGYRVQAELDQLGAHILVAPKGCPYDAASIALHGASWPCYLKESYAADVLNTKGVSAVAPLFMAAPYHRGAGPTVFLGAETNLLALKRTWQIEGIFPTSENEILVGRAVARRLGWQVRQTVALPGITNATGVVAGILAPTQSAEDEFIFLRLRDAQHLFKHTNEITHMLVRLSDPNEMERVVRDLRGCSSGLLMNVIPLTHLFHTIQSLIRSTRLLLSGTTLVALLAASAGVSTTILLAVAERTREIGVMRALGASQTDIFRLFLFETLQMSFAGACAGIAGAFTCSSFLENWLRGQLSFLPNGTLMTWNWAIAAFCLAVALVLGVIAALLPATGAARMPPIQAIRAKGGWT